MPHPIDPFADARPIRLAARIDDAPAARDEAGPTFVLTSRRKFDG